DRVVATPGRYGPIRSRSQTHFPETASTTGRDFRRRHEASGRKYSPRGTALPSRPDGSGEPSHGKTTSSPRLNKEFKQPLTGRLRPPPRAPARRGRGGETQGLLPFSAWGRGGGGRGF